MLSGSFIIVLRISLVNYRSQIPYHSLLKIDAFFKYVQEVGLVVITQM